MLRKFNCREWKLLQWYQASEENQLALETSFVLLSIQTMLMWLIAKGQIHEGTHHTTVVS